MEPMDRQALPCAHVASFPDVEKSGILVLLSNMLAQDAFARDVPTDITNPMQMVSDLQRIMLCPLLRSPEKEAPAITAVDGENGQRKENGGILCGDVRNVHSQSSNSGALGEDASMEVQCSFGEEALRVQAPLQQDSLESLVPVSVSNNTLLASEHEASSSMEAQGARKFLSPSSSTETHNTSSVLSSVERQESSRLSSSIETHDNSCLSFALVKKHVTLPSNRATDLSSASTDHLEAPRSFPSRSANVHKISHPSSSPAMADQALNLSFSLSDGVHKDRSRMKACLSKPLDHASMKAGRAKPLSVITQRSLMSTPSSSASFSSDPLLVGDPILLDKHCFPLQTLPADLIPPLDGPSPVVPSSSVSSLGGEEPATKRPDTNTSLASLEAVPASLAALPSTDKKHRKRRCGLCERCKSVRCGVCRFCLDNPKYGGPGTLKQTCMQRRCKNVSLLANIHLWYP